MKRRALAAFALAVACVAAPTPEPVATSRIEWGGCALEFADARCVLTEDGPGRIVVWVEHGDPELRLVVDAGEAVAGEPLDGGQRFAIEIESGTLALFLGETRLPWSLVVERRRPSPALRALSEAPRTAGYAGDFEAAVAALPPAERARGYRAGFARAHAQADAAAAERFAFAALGAAVAAGELSTACGVAQAASFSALHLRGDVARARAWLETTRFCPIAVPASAPGFAYYSGLIAAALGRHVDAVEYLEQASARASRIDHVDDARQYAIGQALFLGEAGFTEAATMRLAALVEAFEPGCVRVVAMLDHAWAVQLAAEASGERELLREAEAELIAALDESELHHCSTSSPHVEAIIRIDLAHGALGLGEFGHARHELARIDAGRLEPGLARWYRRLDAQVAMAEGRIAAARAWIAGIDDAGIDDDASWRDHLVAARLASALGDEASARLHDRAAEAALDRVVSSFAEGLASGPLLGARVESSTRIVADAVRRGDAHAAWCTARRARRRALQATAGAALRVQDDRDGAVAERLAAYRGQAARVDAELEGLDLASRRERAASQARLRTELAVDLAALAPSMSTALRDGCGPPTPASTLSLGFHPRGDGGWFAFAELDGRVAVSSLDDPESLSRAELARALFDPVDEMLARAERVRVLPAGAWNRVDLHALDWRGAPLVDAKPVAYALDLSLPTADVRRGAAVVFADVDPLRELGTHAGPLRRALDTDRAGVRWSAGADRRELQRMLGDVDTWTFFGHSRMPKAEASNMPWQWSRGLLVGTDASLDAFEVLMLPAAAPRRVALVGCSTGVVDPALPPGSITLAQAFIVRGAGQVLATHADIAPRHAVEVARRLAPELGGGGEADLAVALRRAQLDLRVQAPDAPWPAWRVWEP